MKYVSLLLFLVVLLPVAATAQSPCGPTGIIVTVTPTNPTIGQLITVTLTNPTTTTVQLSDSCVFKSVREKNCSGPIVTAYGCLTVITPIPPSTSISLPWDQTDISGKQVKPGTYAFDIWFYGPAGKESCCPTVTIGNPCPGPFPYGSGNSGSGGFVPVLGSFGLPQVGNPAFQIDITNGLGGALSGLFVGFNSASIPTTWGTFLVDPNPPFAQVIFPLGGPFGSPGTGTATIPAPIPAIPALAGVSAYMQSVISDPGSSGGFSHSQGLNIVICP